MAIACRLPRVVPSTGWTYGSHFFPAGTNVGVSAWELHLNETVFPEPRVFKPERWLDATPEMNESWLPFGKGARSCIARNLAMQEVLIATEEIAGSGVLEGGRVEGEEVKIYEWFNSRVKGDKVEITWDREGEKA